jgi:regulator of sigma E protease
MNVPYILSVLLLVFGFGFVIFWHELGHFLAAKWVGIKVEQFAVGFGQAILAWRKGIGLRVGTTQREYEKRLKEYVEKEEGHLDRRDRSAPTAEQLHRAAEKLGLGETEYRLNWIPLGGYVKMLGQDDLNPTAQSDDPRSYNRKSIPARMLVVSAGVIMNVILAAVGFMVVFMIGFSVPPAQVGGVVPN